MQRKPRLKEVIFIDDGGNQDNTWKEIFWEPLTPIPT